MLSGYSYLVESTEGVRFEVLMTTAGVATSTSHLHYIPLYKLLELMSTCSGMQRTNKSCGLSLAHDLDYTTNQIN